jgi:hypothetical protein
VSSSRSSRGLKGLVNTNIKGGGEEEEEEEEGEDWGRRARAEGQRGGEGKRGREEREGEERETKGGEEK